MLVSPACCTNLPQVLIKCVLNRLFIVNKNIFLQIIHAWHQTKYTETYFMNFSSSSCKIFSYKTLHFFEKEYCVCNSISTISYL